MITVHCVDISGSMSSDQIETAQQEVLKRFRPKDIVALFDIGFGVATDLERCFASYYKDHVIGRGGTDATKVFEFAKKHYARAILYSDGWLPQDQIDRFDQFIKIP